MTTPARPSSAASVLQRPRFSACLLAAGLALALPLAACGIFHSDFDIAVGNRTANAVSVLANGAKIGEVGSNQTITLTLEESPTGHTTIDSTGGPTSPIPVAQVTFAVQDMTTGALSAGVAATLVKGVTSYVDVAPCVVIAAESPPCVSVSSTTTGSASGARAGSRPLSTCSLSKSDQSFGAIGCTGDVSVNTSSGCAWRATSSASWLTVTSGTSGTTTGVVVFQVAANTTGQARTASLNIGGQTFTVNQTA